MVDLNKYKIIDLTLKLDENTPPYPGDPKFEKEQYLFCEKDIVNTFKFSTSTQLGTHIQSSFYTNANGKKLNEINIERFIGECLVLDVNLGEIPMDLLRKICSGKNLPTKVIFRSNCKVDITEDDLLNDRVPYLSVEGAKLLLENGFNFFGSDAPCIAKYPDYEAKKYLCQQDVILLDNLTNLKNIKRDRIFLIALPLNLQDTEGAPCRVIALEEK